MLLLSYEYSMSNKLVYIEVTIRIQVIMTKISMYEKSFIVSIHEYAMCIVYMCSNDVFRK